jgi:hypothetical protein
VVVPCQQHEETLQEQRLGEHAQRLQHVKDRGHIRVSPGVKAGAERTFQTGQVAVQAQCLFAAELVAGLRDEKVRQYVFHVLRQNVGERGASEPSAHPVFKIEHVCAFQELVEMRRTSAVILWHTGRCQADGPKARALGDIERDFNGQQPSPPATDGQSDQCQ